MRDLTLLDTSYLASGLLLSLVLPMMLSLRAPQNLTVRRSALSTVWCGQFLLAAAGLVILASSAAAPFAALFGALSCTACVVVLECSVGRMTKALWLTFSSLLCFLVAQNYQHINNDQYLLRWWEHCKHCAVGVKPWFDANNFTMIFFALLCVLATAPWLFAFKPRLWPMVAGATINAVICVHFMKQNLWA